MEEEELQLQDSPCHSETLSYNIEKETLQEPFQPSPSATAATTDTPAKQPKKMPLALRNLLPYNKPGRQGLAGEKRV